MKTYEVVLCKSYIVRILAEDESKAREYSEFFTGDIADISSPSDRKKLSFKIENIDCKCNDVFEVVEIDEKR